MSGWIRLHSEPAGEGGKIKVTASADVELAEESHVFETKEEMQDATQRWLLYAEYLLRQGRVESIHMNGEPYPPAAPMNP